MPKTPRKKDPGRSPADAKAGTEGVGTAEECTEEDPAGRRAGKAAKGERATKGGARRGGGSRTPPPAARPPEAGDTEQEKAFLETLVETGQAAPLDAEGKLPPGATHELVEDEEGKPKAVRRRFSLY